MLTMSKKKPKFKIENLPLYCDYSCEFADFTDPECIGACRRDLAVWCKILERYNIKHAKCLVRKQKLNS